MFFSQLIAISFQSKRLDCWADILCWKRGGSILGFKKLKFFSSSFSLNNGGARISWGFVLVSLCFDDNMSHAGRQQAWLSFPRWWLQTMESSREVIIKTLIKFKNIHLKVCLWGHLGHVRYRWKGMLSSQQFNLGGFPILGDVWHKTASLGSGNLRGGQSGRLS